MFIHIYTYIYSHFNDIMHIARSQLNDAVALQKSSALESLYIFI